MFPEGNNRDAKKPEPANCLRVSVELSAVPAPAPGFRCHSPLMRIQSGQVGFASGQIGRLHRFVDIGCVCHHVRFGLHRKQGLTQVIKGFEDCFKQGRNARTGRMMLKYFSSSSRRQASSEVAICRISPPAGRDQAALDRPHDAGRPFHRRWRAFFAMIESQARLAATAFRAWIGRVLHRQRRHACPKARSPFGAGRYQGAAVDFGRL